MRPDTLQFVSDEYLDPDEIIDPNDPRRGGAGADFDPTDTAGLAERAVDSFLLLVRRANALAGGVLLFVLAGTITGYALGLAALSGGIRTVWAVVGGFFAILAIGMVVTAMLRLRRVRKSSDELVGEMTSLIGGNRQNERVVVETVRRTDEGTDVSIVQLTRGMGDMQAMVGGQAQNTRNVVDAVRAITTFPLFMIFSTFITVGFVFLGLLFLIALAI